MPSLNQPTEGLLPFSLGTMYWQNPNHGRRELEDDMRRIKENRFSIIRAFVWWEQLERREGEFDFGMHDELFAAAEKFGVGIMETLGLYPPFWLQRKLDREGIYDPTRYACFDRPEVAEPLSRYLNAVVDRYRGASALRIWNVWNEPTKPPCHCEHTRTKFLDWLKARYQGIDALRSAWLSEYAVFDTICPDSFESMDLDWLDDAFRLGTRGRITPLLYDWQEFSTVNLTDNARWLADEVRKIDPDHPTHANPAEPLSNALMNGVDVHGLTEVLDSISVSVHPSHQFAQVESDASRYAGCYAYCCDGIRSWGHAHGKEAWIGELQAGTTFHHVSPYTPSADDISHYLWQALGRGLDGVLFWAWQSWRSSLKEVGEFGLRRCADGEPTERSEAAAAFGEIIDRYPDILRDLRRPQSEVAVLVSLDSANLKAMQKRIMEGLGDFECEHNHAVYGCYTALNRANIAVDFITEAQVEAGVLADYKVLYLPHVEVMGAATAEQIQAFVHAGGHLWADGRCAFLDEHVYLRTTIPGHGLDLVFGCREDDFVAVRGDVEIGLSGGVTCRGYRHQQSLEVTTGEVCATFPDGRPASVCNHFGLGTAQLVGSYVALGLQKRGDDTTADFVAGFALRAGIKPKVVINPPTGIEACLLSGTETDLIILTNHTGGCVAVEVTAPSEYLTIVCPMDGERRTSYSEGIVRRVLREAETVAVFCGKTGDDC